MANAEHKGRVSDVWRTRPGRTGAVGVILLVFAAVATLLGGGMIEASRWSVRESAAHWIPGIADGLPYRPPQGVKPRSLRAWSLDAPGYVQIYFGLDVRRDRLTAMTLTLPVVEGEATLFVNGVPVDETISSSGRFLAVPGGRAVMWRIPADFLRPGANRFDIMVAGARHRALAAPMVLAPQDRATPLFRVVADFNAELREWLPVLSMLAAALALAVAAALRAARPWIALSAAAAAMGGRAALSELVLPAGLDRFWPLMDQTALCAALFCVGCAFFDSQAALSQRARRWGAAGAGLLTLLIGLAGIGAWRGPGALETAGLLVPLPGLAFLIWAAVRNLEPRAGRTILQRGTKGAALGVSALTVTAAVVGASGLASGLWVPGLEVAYGLGLAALISGLAIASGALTTRSIWHWVRDRPRLSRIILSQQQEIAAAALALQQQERRSAVLEERQRLSRDMHDGIGGQLISLLARVRSRRITPEQLEGELSNGLSELRLMVDSLDASDGSVADALSVLRSRIRTQAEAARMSLDWSQSEALSAMTAEPNWMLNLNRLIQEAVTNAIRHAGADRLEVAVELIDHQTLEVMIRDNGVGFDRDKVQPGRGLSNLTYRAAQMGGLIEIGRDEIGVGTVIRSRVIVPGGEPAPLALGVSPATK